MDADRSARPLGKRVYRWVKKLHMYAGLLTYCQFTLYGLAGLLASVRPGPEERAPFPLTTTELAYRSAPGATDKQIADEIHALLDPPLSGPVPEWAVRRADDGQLQVTFHSVNGPTRVAVLEERGMLRVERVRNSAPRFLSNLHATTVRDWTGDWRLRVWAWLNELGLWALLGLALSGVYLWLASRPRLGVAVASSLGGLAGFVFLWFLIR